MQTQRNKMVRLYVTAPLGSDMTAELTPAQAHYLRVVLRLDYGTTVMAFNNQAGEWRTAMESGATGRTVQLRCVHQTQLPEELSDLWLLFAPLKRARTDWVAEKACELGCSRIQPVCTERTNNRRINGNRLRAHTVDAAEQCGRCAVPEVLELTDLDGLLAQWPAGRRLLFCDERRVAPPIHVALSQEVRGRPWAVLTGPEGGFTPAEVKRITACADAVPVALGPRVLRADTAAVAALSIWQSQLGDWSSVSASQ